MEKALVYHMPVKEVNGGSETTVRILFNNVLEIARQMRDYPHIQRQIPLFESKMGDLLGRFFFPEGSEETDSLSVILEVDPGVIEKLTIGTDKFDRAILSIGDINVEKMDNHEVITYVTTYIEEEYNV